MSKTFTLVTLGLAMIASSATAAPTTKHDNNLRNNKRTELTSARIDGKEFTIANRHGDIKKSPAKHTDRVTPVITEVSGETKTYKKNADGFFTFWGWIFDYNMQDIASEVTFGANNEVYFYNFFSEGQTDSYLKGTLEGDKITVQLPQTLIWVEDDPEYGSYGANVNILDYEIDYDYSTVDATPDFGTTSFTLTVGEDGSITMDDLGEGRMVGLVYTDDDSWSGYGDVHQKLVPFTPVFTSMPEGVEAENYVYLYGDYGYGTKVAFAGDKLYIQNLCTQMPGAVIEATVEGNKAYVPQGQLVGIAYGCYIETRCGYLNPAYDPEDWESEEPYMLLAPADARYELVIDPEAKTISSADAEMTLVLSVGDDVSNGVEFLSDFTLSYQETYAGTPQDPIILAYEDNTDNYGYYSLYLDIPVIGTDGNLLDYDSVYYRIYVDGDVLEFESDDEMYTYQGIPEGEVWTNIPLGFNNEWDIYAYSPITREVGIYLEGYETLGAQTVYEYEGTTTYSNIVTLNVETGEIETGVSAVSSEAAAAASYVDLYGRYVTPEATGIIVKVCRMADGSVKTSKMIKK